MTAPREFGPAWDRIINLMTEHRYRPVPRLIIGPAKWLRVLEAAGPEDRATLEAMEASGAVIISHHLPDPEIAYRYEPSPEAEQFLPRVEWAMGGVPVDRMTDEIRRRAGGPS